MAEGTSRGPGDTIRSYYYHSPRNDEGYMNSHHSNRRNNEKKVCHFYLQGKCCFEDKCWFSHSSLKADGSSKSHGRFDKHAGPSRQRFDNRESTGPPKPEPSKREYHQPRYSYQHKKGMKNNGAPVPHPPNWINAPEFVPRIVKSYADILKCNSSSLMHPEARRMTSSELCSYFVSGDCPYEGNCPYVHGDMCELCGKACLHPYDKRQRKGHIEFCEKELEKDMELSFAIQRSIDKTCGICMDVIMEKEPISERRFGILEKCNHVFCLACIRKWRKVKTFETSTHIDTGVDPCVTRSCPECRVASDFITPSQYWVDTAEEKTKLITEYKWALSQKPCKYFKQGKGNCPFGGACFYLHARPDGTKVELPLPVRRRRQNQDGELDFLGRIFLWDYLEFREENIFMQLDLVLDDFVYALSDSDDDTSIASDNFFLSEAF